MLYLGCMTVTTWTETLRNTNTEELVHLTIVHDEGTLIGDAAWTLLQGRAGFRGALALIAAEKEARELDVWTQRMQAIAAAVMAA